MPLKDISSLILFALPILSKRRALALSAKINSSFLRIEYELGIPEFNANDDHNDRNDHQAMVRVGSFRRRRALGRASGRGNRQARKRTHAVARSFHGRRTRELDFAQPSHAPSPSPSSPRGDVFTHHVFRRRRRRTNDATTRRERYNSDEGSE